MNFNQNVDRDVVDAILESSLWQKAKVNVVSRESLVESSEKEAIGDIPEYEGKEIANGYAEPTAIDETDVDAEALSFTLDDLQCVLDNLEDDDLMEHALSMLEVFDVAYENLLESGDEDEDEEEEEEEEEADETEE